MNYDTLSAWAAGAGFSGLTPVDPGRSSATPVQPGRSTLAPVDPYSALAALAQMAAQTPVDPGRAGSTPVQPGYASATPVDPWRGRVAPDASGMPMPSVAPPPRRLADPDWVFMRADALTAQAVRRSHAKTFRAPERWLPDEVLDRAANRGERVGNSHIWRWAPEFRVKALSCQLLNRTLVLGHRVWVLDVPELGGPETTVFHTEGHSIYSLADPWPDVLIIEQADRVVRAATEREDRMPEILAQADGFWPFFETLTGFPLTSTPALMQLLATADDWAHRVLMALKHACAIRRPVQWASRVRPVIPTPGHGSLPSGHATMAALAAELLRTLLALAPDSLRSRQFDLLARRIAFNRVVAGVHFPVDSQAGYALGTQLARVLAAWAGASEHLPQALETHDVLRDEFTLPEDGTLPEDLPGNPAGRTMYDLAALWIQAEAELQLVLHH